MMSSSALLNAATLSLVFALGSFLLALWLYRRLHNKSVTYTIVLSATVVLLAITAMVHWGPAAVLPAIAMVVGFGLGEWRHICEMQQASILTNFERLRDALAQELLHDPTCARAYITDFQSEVVARLSAHFRNEGMDVCTNVHHNTGKAIFSVTK